MIKALVLSLFCASAGAAEMGLHLASYHSPDTGFNNENAGIYGVMDNGLTAGFYKNSIRKDSYYIGYTSPEWMRVRMAMGLIAGYKPYAVPMIAPQIRLFTVKQQRDGIGFISDPKTPGSWSARITVIPKIEEKGVWVFHLTIGTEF